MIRVTITAGAPREVSGMSKATGKPYRFFTQTAYFHCHGRDGKVNAFPDKAEVNVDTAAEAYPPGEYQLDPTSVYVDRNGRVQLSPRLRPIAASKAG